VEEEVLEEEEEVVEDLAQQRPAVDTITTPAMAAVGAGAGAGAGADSAALSALEPSAAVAAGLTRPA
jgi:hypothetical protein